MIGRGGQSHEGSGDGGEGITQKDDPFPFLKTVGKPSRDEFQKTRNTFSNSLNETDKENTCSQDLGQKEGQKGVDHLTRDIIEETDPAQVPYIPRKTPEKTFFLLASTLMKICAKSKHSILHLVGV